MLNKKKSINNLSHMVLMWHFFFFCHILVAGSVIIIFLEIANKNRSSDYKDYLLLGLLFLVYLFVLLIWKKVTFRRRDVIELTESLGVKFINKLYYYSPLEVIGVYSYARGYMDSIHVVAKMDLPFFAYAPFRRIPIFQPTRDGQIVLSGGDGPEYMKEESRVELFSLIRGTADVDMTIKIEDGKRDMSVTGIEVIDDVFSTALKGVDYFHARLFFNKDCLRMSIIGGSWEGRRFGEKILKGFEIFQTLNSELKGKYQVGDWKDWQVNWNKKEENFYLESKGIAL